MRTRTVDAIASVGLHILGWCLATMLFILVRYFGLETVEAFRAVDFSQFDYGYYVLMGLTAGVVLGLAFALIDLALDRSRMRHLPYGKLILLQSAIHIALLVVVVAAVRASGSAREGEAFDAATWLSRTFSSGTKRLAVTVH